MISMFSTVKQRLVQWLVNYTMNWQVSNLVTLKHQKAGL